MLNPPAPADMPGAGQNKPLDISADAQRLEPVSLNIHVIALTFTKMADSLLDVKLVLPWLLAAVGAPAAYVGWLVPIRESLALLPQMLVARFTVGFSIRKYFWTLGSLLQGVCALAMAWVPTLTSGHWAGLAILGLLIVFSLARCVCSVVIKDVEGRTIDRAARGGVSGTATSLAGIVTIIVATSLLTGLISPDNQLALSWMLTGAAACWFVGAYVYVTLPELADTENADSDNHYFSQLKKLLRDGHLRHFLITRSLFISTALVAPFFVYLANQANEGSLSALGLLLLLAGIANLVSGRFWGVFSDSSSRRVLAICGLLCGGLSVAVVAAALLDAPWANTSYWFGAVIFVLYIGHAGVRQGRTTYLIDMGNANNRAALTALSNTIIGIVLLCLGSLLAAIGNDAVLVIIGVLGCAMFAAAASAWTLPEVSGSDHPSNG